MCGPLLAALPAMTHLLFASTPASSPSPYPIEASNSLVAKTLVADLDDFDRALRNTPNKLSEEVVETVRSLKFTAFKLRRCLMMDFDPPLGADLIERNAASIRASLPWMRCEGRSDAKKCVVEGEELMACSRVSLDMTSTRHSAARFVD